MKIKGPYNPLAIAYIVLALVLAGAFVRTEMIAQQVEVEACQAFQQSQELLKDVLLLAIPTDVETSEDMAEAEKLAAETEAERRKAFRNRLIREIDDKEC